MNFMVELFGVGQLQVVLHVGIVAHTYWQNSLIAPVLEKKVNEKNEEL